jgi:hypothetical protein
MNVKQMENQKAYMLNKLATVDRTNLNRACIQLSARGISYRVKVSEPNVIYYWVTKYGIAGSLRIDPKLV